MARPTLGGRLVVRFTIGRSGRVLGTEVQESDLGSPAVEGCVRGVFARMAFPASAGVARISYPLVFRPAGP